MLKNKAIYISILFLIILLILPYSYISVASSDSVYVWSSNNTPETVPSNADVNVEEIQDDSSTTR